MAENCCLCNADIKSGTNKVKRKLLNGKSAVKATEVLENLLLEGYDLSIESIPKLTGEKVYICHKCNQNLEDLPAILEQST